VHYRRWTEIVNGGLHFNSVNEIRHPTDVDHSLQQSLRSTHGPKLSKLSIFRHLQLPFARYSTAELSNYDCRLPLYYPIVAPRTTIICTYRISLCRSSINSERRHHRHRRPYNRFALTDPPKLQTEDHHHSHSSNHCPANRCR